MAPLCVRTSGFVFRFIIFATLAATFPVSECADAGAVFRLYSEEDLALFIGPFWF